MSVPGTHLQQEGGSLPAYLASGFHKAAQEALALSRQPYQAFPGERIAPLPPAVAEAANLANRTGAYIPHLTMAHQHGRQGARSFPGAHKEYFDPYTEPVLSGIAKQGRRTLKESILPELDARFIKLGQHGSSKHARLATKATRDIQNEIMSQQEDALSKGYLQSLQGFNSDAERELQAAGLLNQLGMLKQGSQMADIEALTRAGQLEQAQQQRLLDFAYEQWKERMRHPHEALGQYFSVLHGTPYVPSTYRRSEIPRPSQTMHRGDWSRLALNMVENLLQGREQPASSSSSARPGSFLSGLFG